MGSGVDGDVLEMLVNEGSLYVVGRFVHAGGRLSTRIARWDDVITPVAIQDFFATVGSDGVNLQWRLASTAREELLGVRVQRADDHLGPYRTLSETPLLPEIEMSFLDSEIETGKRYSYRLLLDGRDGSPQVAGPITITVGTGLATSLRTPRDPGPGEPLPIRYSIGTSRAAAIRLDVYDVRGRLVRALGSGAVAPGEHVYYWDRTNSSGVRLPRGVYLVQLQADGARMAKRLVLLHE